MYWCVLNSLSYLVSSPIHSIHSLFSDAHVPLICSVNDLKLTKNADIAPAPLCKDFDDHWDLIKSFYKNRL